MNPEHWQNVKAIFNSLLDVDDDQRGEVLAMACNGDAELRRDVEELLASYRTGFLENSASNGDSDSNQDHAMLKPGDRVGHFEIVRLLGIGGMGQVYLAQDCRLSRSVAIKVLTTSGLSSDAAQFGRFIREAQAASALNHSNICTIYEINPDHIPPYIAMEFIEGKTIAQKIAEGEMQIGQAFDISIQAAEALAEAHDLGIVHRDIKPANIIVNKRRQVKIVDFGLAKKIFSSADDLTQRQLSSSGMIIGTVRYMSPEQARGKEIDRQTDIWSLGVVLYEMISGKRPFDGDNTGDVIASILKAEPPALELSDAEISEELKRIFGKALAKSKEDRYPDARHLIADLRRVKENLLTVGAYAAANQAHPHDRTTLVLDHQTADARRITQPAVDNGKSRSLVNSYTVAASLLILILGGLVTAVFYFGRSAPIDSLAVMPLLNQTGNPESEYLSDGITESLIGRLSQIPDLSVKARSSVFRFKGKDVAIKDIGKELSVPGIITGRLSRRGNEYSLYIELVDAATEKVIWQAEYNRPESSLATIPGEVARDVANKLRQKLSTVEERSIAKSYTDNSVAYELYLKGRFYWDKRNEESYKVAEDAYKQAIALDPNYALAYAGLADCYLFRESGLGRDVAMPKAKEFALKALEIDESLAEAHTTLAFVNANYDLDFSKGEKEFKRAIELKPNYAIAHQFYGSLLMATGRTEDALAEMRRAVDLEPYTATINWSLGMGLGFARRYDESIAQLQKTLKIQPDFALAEGSLAGMFIQTGRFDDAMGLVRKHLAKPGRTDQALANLAIIYAKTGRYTEAQNALNKLLLSESKSQNNPYNIAGVYAAIGETDKATEWLNKALERRSFSIWFVNVDPFFFSLHEDPGFQELLRRIGLVS